MSITINSTRYLVTPGLYGFLELMRDRNEYVLTFIDAICIAQGDEEEKTHQVQLMGDVYRGAETVYACQT